MADAQPAHLRTSSVARRLLPSAPVYAPALMIAIGGWQRRWMDEDAFINLRVIDQIFAGHGPVFNAGERIEPATSTLWMFVLVVARALFGAFASMEWITLLASLGVAVAAFTVAGRGTRMLHQDDEGMTLPVGLILVASVAVVWDFATSGLEMGLVWLWLAASWCVLVVAARSGEIAGRKRSAFAAVLGLAPLVRPDLTLMLLCFMVAWFALVRPRRIAIDLVAMLALPVAYQIFRMGYYAAVVPAPALAKDAGGLHVGQGWDYAENFVGAYWLWLTGIVAGITIIARTRVNADRRVMTITAAMLAAGALHALYITAIGGDYMHGRLLLPAFFALALPASMAVTRRGASVVGISAFTVAWATCSVVAFRPPPNTRSYLLSPISDWRAVSGARLKPVDAAFGLNGLQAAAAYDRGVRGYFKISDKQPRRAIDSEAFVLTLASIGVPAYNAGRRIWVVDIGGLAEPLAARTDPIPGRVAGHRKEIDAAWYDARFGAATGDPKAAAARRALTCGPVRELLDAVNAKLTPARFLSNIWHSVEYTTLRIPSDPVVAEQQWCTRSR
jgi:arabinofuranosyltransferase